GSANAHPLFFKRPLNKSTYICKKDTYTMTTKLTLTVEKRVIDKAKVFAKRTGRSLSEIIESYLEQLTNEEPADQKGLSPKLRNLIGSIKLPKDFDEDKMKREHLQRKHQ
ncbi:MAG TPA: DUF6364 family protein, partial [Saprospiraceae bacterium]|nr:DUF6364 family protein [Saprospiraceae bacterium]